MTDRNRSAMFASNYDPSEDLRKVQAFNWGRLGNEHVVQCFQHDAVLSAAVGSFLAPAFLKGEAGIVIASKEHRSAIDDSLARRGMDPLQLQRRGQYISLDATDVLNRISINGRPDRGLFFKVVGMLISQASNSWSGIRAFGEMVDVLWREGKKEYALELEELWNNLAKIYPFALFCAYSRSSTDFGDECFSHVCEAHSLVIL